MVGRLKEVELEMEMLIIEIDKFNNSNKQIF